MFVTVKGSLLNVFLLVCNYLAFYLIWVGCLYAAGHQLSCVAASFVGVYLVLHLLFVSERPIAELFLILAVIFLGTLNDCILTLSGIVTYMDASWLGTSWWMTGIWGCFGSTYWHTFSWLESRKLLAALLGAIAVPLCYLWGAEANVLSFSVNQQLALLIVAVLWAFLLPLSFVMSLAIKNAYTN